MSCPVCCERRMPKTPCPYCAYAPCQACVKRYILGSNTDPRCMMPECGRTWTNDHLFSMLPKQFLTKQYKEHRETVLKEREMAMMAETQAHVERAIRKERILEEVHQLEDQMAATRLQINVLLAEYRAAGATTARGIVGNTKSEFMGRCSKEECKGFVCADKKACGICQTKFCPQCFVEAQEGADHQCRPEDLETYNMLKKDSKPCPACAVLIFRISGCSQMFCTSCHTVFDWRTLEIQKDRNAVIHNPHFFAWRAANNNNEGPGPRPDPGPAAACGQDVTFTLLEWSCNRLPRDDSIYLMTLYRMTHHIRAVERTRYTAPDRPDFVQNLDLRIEYLRNRMTEKQFTSKIQIREKAENKKRDIQQILDAFVQVSNDIMLSFVQAKTVERPKMVKTVKQQVDGLFECSKEALDKVHDKYNCVVPDLKKMMQDWV